MAGQGVAPLDPTTLTGQTRALIGDTVYTELDPPVVGEGVYPYFSDTEILGFLAGATSSPLRAAGLAYLQLAAGQVLISSSVSVEDLAITNLSRGPNLAAIAASFLREANAAELSGRNEFYLDFFPFGPAPSQQFFAF